MFFEPDSMSRSPNSSPVGKCDDRLDVPMPSRMKEQLAALAIAAGYGSTGEYVREHLAAHLYGHVASLQAAYGRRRPAAMGRNDDEADGA
jgi:hypothetical protein